MAGHVPEGSETPGPSTDPIIKAWQGSQLVMNRLLAGCLVQLPAGCKKIKREHLGENVELLAPILDKVGPLMASILGKAYLAKYLATLYVAFCAQVCDLQCMC